MEQLERKSCETSLKSVNDEGEITALVSIFGNLDRSGEVVKAGAFKASLEKRLPVGVWAHQWDKPCAKTLSAVETAEGLMVHAKFNLETQSGREAYSNIKQGLYQDFSIGYRVVRDSVDKEKGFRLLEELELFEWSPVLVGMNDSTRLLSIKSSTAEAAVEEPMQASNKAVEDDSKTIVRPRIFSGNQNPYQTEEKSIGQQFIESPVYQNYVRTKFNGESEPFTLDASFKVLTTVTGWPVQSVRAPTVVPYATRPLRVADIIPTISTSQNSFVYMEETTYTNAAVETAEGALKPEANLALTQRTSPVRKIPVWIAVTEEQLEDQPGMMDYVQSRLGFMVQQRLDSQILVGTGISPNLLGILSTAGIQTQAKSTDPTPDAIYKAMNKVRTVGFAEPSHLVIHPNDWAEVRLLRTTDGIYIYGNPYDSGSEFVFGIPVIQTTSISEGTCLVGDFTNYALLVERKGLTLKIGYNADDFLKNQKSIIAEIRVAFATLRPTAFCTVTGV